MANTIVYRAITSTGNQEKWTFSGWFKYNPTGQGGSSYQRIFDCGGDTEYLRFTESSGVLIWKSYTEGFTTNRVFKDPGAFYHIVLRVDCTTASNLPAGDRMRLYINGVEETSFSSEVTPDTGHNTKTNTSGNDFVLGGASATDQNFNGIMSHVHLCDGYSYAPTEFGEEDATSGIWKIKTSPSVSYGTNGFFMKFEDRSNLDLDSGTNDFTFTTSTSGSGALVATYDNPSNNFCTANSLMHNMGGGGTFTFSNGSNTIYRSVSDWKSVGATLPISASKWYWETEVGGWGMIGIWATWNNTDSSSFGSLLTNGGTTGSGPQSFAYKSDGYKYQTGYSGTAGYGDTWSDGDIIGTAVDLDNGKIYFSHNGTWQNSGDPTSGATGTGSAYDVPTDGFYDKYLPAWTVYGNTMNINFGNGYFGTTAITTNSGAGYADDAGVGKFNYDVPAGYYSICTKNIKTYGG